jgi:peptide/nickel transport system permease protein
MAQTVFSETADSETPQPLERSRGSTSTLNRLAKYTAARTVALLLTVIVGVYLTILIANMGGHVDAIRLSQIREQVGAIAISPEFRQLPRADRDRLIEELVAIEVQRVGLDRPFLFRSFTFLGNAITLNLGRAEYLTSDSGSGLVRLIILERLPATLVLVGITYLVLFFSAIFLALILSRQYGSWLDKTMVALAPTSAAPAWFYGLFLILIFAALLGWLPFGGMVAAPPPADRVAYALSVLRHLLLPAAAFIVSSLFLAVYSWRTFFLIYSTEDYVEMAKAKGLTSRQVERRYVLRPTLPNIITSFALAVIGLYQGAIILETVFNWPGLGRLIFQAIGLFDTPVIVGVAVIYAYLLGITVFLLDIVYALVDPRVRIGS